MKNPVTRIVRSVVEWFGPARHVQPEPRITPEQLRQALAAMLADPQGRRLILQNFVGTVLPISGGVCAVMAKDVGPGIFGSDPSCSPAGGVYSFPSNLVVRGNTLQIGRFVDADLPGMGILYSESQGTSTTAAHGYRWASIWKWEHDFSGGIVVPQMQLDQLNILSLYNRHDAVGTVAVQLSPIGHSYFLGGNVGIGTTNPSEKLDVVGKIKSDGLNKIVFLRPLGGGQNDSTQINNAIASLAATNGGIIMLEPSEYRINATINININGVKIRGYGGNWPSNIMFDAGGNPIPGGSDAPVTKLLWVGAAGGRVCDLIPSGGGTNLLRDVEILDLTIEGNASAGMGLHLTNTISSRFVNLVIRNMQVSGGTGIKLTTSGADVTTAWNSFINCALMEVSIGVFLTGGTLTGPNSTINYFENLNIRFRGSSSSDAGILLENADNNLFVHVWMNRSSNTGLSGNSVRMKNDDGAGNIVARANYFYHLQVMPFVAGIEEFLVTNADTVPPNKTMIFGYDRENGQPPPVARTAGSALANAEDFLFWVDSKGAVRGGGGTVQSGGTPLPQRSVLNFDNNTGIQAADNAASARTDISLREASSTQMGAVTTGGQTFAGGKTFQAAASFLSSVTISGFCDAGSLKVGGTTVVDGARIADFNDLKIDGVLQQLLNSVIGARKVKFGTSQLSAGSVTVTVAEMTSVERALLTHVFGAAPVEHMSVGTPSGNQFTVFSSDPASTNFVFWMAIGT